MKQKIEVVRLVDQYHSIIVNGNLLVRDSSLPLADSLAFCFRELGKVENISITTTSFDYYDNRDYEKYLDSKC